MLKWEDAGAVYLFTRPIDMRCGFDRLAELALAEVGRSPLRGGVFVFVSRCRRRAKSLFWERDGYWLLYKRLEAGTFRIEHRDGYEELDGVDLKLLLEGAELSRIKLRKAVEQGVYG